MAAAGHRYIFNWYNSSAFGVSSFYSFIEVKAADYTMALQRAKKLLPVEQEVSLHAVLTMDNPFVLPSQRLFEGKK